MVKVVGLASEKRKTFENMIFVTRGRCPETTLGQRHVTIGMLAGRMSSTAIFRQFGVSVARNHVWNTTIYSLELFAIVTDLANYVQSYDVTISLYR